jgi:DNA invertase Pin-like site-specific DNA recombinase
MMGRLEAVSVTSVKREKRRASTHDRRPTPAGKAMYQMMGAFAEFERS